MGIEVIISCIASACIAGGGIWLSWFAVRHAGQLPKRNPEHVRQIMKEIDWKLLDEVMDPPPRRRTERYSPALP
ncbi:hypothetical protein [Ruegeria atlantica]|uniref:hypothetical protein n=1 Tax=Ruegeria atlantica TaxID=81569 RepID=UPI0024941054|nr:hypothetical protein [Ruegeria atlantica]